MNRVIIFYERKEPRARDGRGPKEDGVTGDEELEEDTYTEEKVLLDVRNLLLRKEEGPP